MKGQVLANFLIGLFFAASASAADIVESPWAEPISGGNASQLPDTPIVGPRGNYSPGFGLWLPTGPEPNGLGTRKQRISFQCDGFRRVNLVSYVYMSPLPDQQISITAMERHREGDPSQPSYGTVYDDAYGHEHDDSGVGTGGTQHPNAAEAEKARVRKVGRFLYNGAEVHFGDLIPTGASGKVVLEYETAEVSGIIEVTARCQGQETPESVLFVMGVGLQGLLPLIVEGRTFNAETGHVVGATDTHFDNHYATPGTIECARRLIRKYEDEPGSLGGLEINDMSLVRGGIFDIIRGADETEYGGANGEPYGPAWTRPHNLHRKGRDFDVNHPPGAAVCRSNQPDEKCCKATDPVSCSNFNKLMAAGKQCGTWIKEGPNSLHLQYLGRHGR